MKDFKMVGFPTLLQQFTSLHKDSQELLVDGILLILGL
jgi:hypothetical protein